jgi:hypothetical protein
MNIIHRIDPCRRSTRKRKIPQNALPISHPLETSSDDESYEPSSSETSESWSVDHDDESIPEESWTSSSTDDADDAPQKK